MKFYSSSTTTSSTVVAYSALLRPKRVGNDRYSPNIKVIKGTGYYKKKVRRAKLLKGF